MKKATSILLIVVLTLPALSKFWIYVEFKVNQNFIAEALCINKEKPMLKCDGKCVLAQKLKAQDKQESKQIPYSLNLKGPVLFLSHTLFNIDHLRMLTSATEWSELLSNRYDFDLLHSIFHPPRFC